MEMNEFILKCFGIDAGVLEEFCQEFDLDWDEDEVFECFENVDFKHCNWEVAQRLLVKTLEKIRDLYEDETDGEVWDYDVSSPSYPCFYYKGLSFYTKEDLEALIHGETPKDE